MTDVFPGARLVQLVEWGMPTQGTFRTLDPARSFSVIHQTGNMKLPNALAEASWRLNDPGLQNSATFFVNRDGSVVQTLGDPLRMAPWANGDVNRPDLSNPRIAALGTTNANLRTIVAIENVAYDTGPGSFPITAAQEATNRRIIAYYHAKAGVPVNRQTVIGHYQLNSVSRPNCPGVDKRLIDRICEQEEDDEMAWIANVKAVRPYISVMGANARSRPEPSLSSKNYANVGGKELLVVGAVQGDVANGSNRWLVYQSGTWGFGVTHESNEASRKELAVADPVLLQKLEAAEGTVAELRTKISAAKLALG